ncbi:uncharacterized protein LOC111123560 [Crassostrea virginica]
MGNSQTRNIASGAINSTRSTAYTSSIDYEALSLDSDSDTDLPYRFSFTRISNLPPLPGVHPLDYKAYINAGSISTVSTNQSNYSRKCGRQTTFHLPLITSHTRHPLHPGGLVTVKENSKEKKQSKTKRRKKKGTKKKKKTFPRL